MILTLDRVFCFDLEEYFCDEKLDEGYIGMKILNVFVGDTNAIMSNERWLISKCKFPNGPSLWSTLDHFFRLSNDLDLHKHLGGRQKILYQFIVHKPKVNERLSQYNRKTADAEVRKISSKSCYSKHCCQTFP